MAAKSQWARGYAMQAGADFATYQLLQRRADVPECHKLLFLQMACEKLVKSYLCNSGTDPKSLQSSHAYVKKVLPIVLRQEMSVVGYHEGLAKAAQTKARQLAGEIECLAPAVDRGGQREDNCEYPWEAGADVLNIPVDWKFEVSSLIAEPSGTKLLKLILGAINRCNG